MINPSNANFLGIISVMNVKLSFLLSSRVRGPCNGDKCKTLEISIIYICLHEKRHLFRRPFLTTLPKIAPCYSLALFLTFF